MRVIEKLREQKGIVKAVIYARFSSDLQREESIDAQIRAIKDFADKNGVIVIGEYIDRAKSATSDKRPDFQRMIADAKSKTFDLVLVHKLDRFSRNRHDSLGYRMELKKNGVGLISVLEQIDTDGPEGIITESVLEAMAEYYSLNLAREVEKGKKENALKCIHVGGTPPLGYDIDKETRKLIVNEHEAQAVQLIFQRYIEGKGYLLIAQELNAKGFKTKRGVPFTTNSIGGILKNEKYTGTYIYNKSAKKDAEGKRNGHAYKPESEWIKIENAIPALVDKDDFNYIQRKLKGNQNKFFGYKHVEEYLLSGKIFCGKCGAPYIGDRRADKRRTNVIVKYVCNAKKRKGRNGCCAREIHRDVLERIVLDKIAEDVFDEGLLERLSEHYNQYKSQKNNSVLDEKNRLEGLLKKNQRDTEYLINLIMSKRSEALFNKLDSLEEEKSNITDEIKKLEYSQISETVSMADIEYTLCFAHDMIMKKSLSNTKQLVDTLVDRVIIYDDYIQIKFTFAKIKEYNPKPPTKEELTANLDIKNLDVTFVTPRNGGEGFAPNIPTSIEILSTLLSRTTSRDNAKKLINDVSLIETYLPHLDLQLIN